MVRFYAVCVRALPALSNACALAVIALLIACEQEQPARTVDDSRASATVNDPTQGDAPRDAQRDAPRADPPPPDAYSDVEPSSDGIGRTYFGREIAQVMGHPAIFWLERGTREAEERTDLLITALQLREGDEVADIGAGSGYFTLPLARAVAPTGTAFAVDIQPEMIDFLAARARTEQVKNIKLILSKIDDVCLVDESVDLVLLVDAYHEFDHPWEVMRSIVRALRPGGRVALVEYRGEDPNVPIKPLHKMTEAQARLEIEATGLVFERNDSILPIQHLLWFRKPTL